MHNIEEETDSFMLQGLKSSAKSWGNCPSRQYWRLDWKWRDAEDTAAFGSQVQHEWFTEEVLDNMMNKKKVLKSGATTKTNFIVYGKEK